MPFRSFATDNRTWQVTFRSDSTDDEDVTVQALCMRLEPVE